MAGGILGRGQISLEYLIIIGVAIGVLIPGILFFYSYTKSDVGSSTNARLNEIGLQVVAKTKGTYALGTGARDTLQFVMPEDVTRAYVNSTELVFVYETDRGISEAVFFSSINMTSTNANGDISVVHPGVTRYRFISKGSVVEISEAT